MVVLENDKETIYLKEKYRNDHRKLIKIYSKSDFLDITLTQLCKKN